MRGQQQPGAQGAQPPMGGNVEQRLSTIEAKLDALVKHLGVKDIPSIPPAVQRPQRPQRPIPPQNPKGSVGPPPTNKKRKPKRKPKRKSKK